MHLGGIVLFSESAPAKMDRFRALRSNFSLIKLKDEERRFQEKLLSLASKDGGVRS